MDESIPTPPPLLLNTMPRWRWAIHLLLLTVYPVTLGVVGAMNHSGSGQPSVAPEHSIAPGSPGGGSNHL